MPSPRCSAAVAAALLVGALLLVAAQGTAGAATTAAAAASVSSGDGGGGAGHAETMDEGEEWHKPGFCGKMDCPEFSVKQARRLVLGSACIGAGLLPPAEAPPAAPAAAAACSSQCVAWRRCRAALLAELPSMRHAPGRSTGTSS